MSRVGFCVYVFDIDRKHRIQKYMTSAACRRVFALGLLKVKIVAVRDLVLLGALLFFLFCFLGIGITNTIFIADEWWRLITHRHYHPTPPKKDAPSLVLSGHLCYNMKLGSA